MKKTLLAVLALVALAGPARAQQPSQSPAEPLGTESFEDAGRHRPPRQDPAPVAQAIELAFGATVWAQVQVSTMGAVVDLSRLYRDGFYKLELIELVLMSAESRKTLAATVQKRRKGERLSRLALDYGLDFDRLEEQALRIQDVVDRLYLPRFPAKKPKREREDPYGYGAPYYYGP